MRNHRSHRRSIALLICCSFYTAPSSKVLSKLDYPPTSNSNSHPRNNESPFDESEIPSHVRRLSGPQRRPLHIRWNFRERVLLECLVLVSTAYSTSTHIEARALTHTRRRVLLPCSAIFSSALLTRVPPQSVRVPLQLELQFPRGRHLKAYGENA